jgi:CBS domain-containing protein
MQVKDFMSSEIETILPSSSIKKAAQKMNKYRVGSLIVSTPGFELLGIVTQRDILKAFVKGLKPAASVKLIMSKDVITIEHDASLEKAATIMVDNGVKHLPVTKKGKCIGIITATDIIIFQSGLTEKLSELMHTPRKLLES